MKKTIFSLCILSLLVVSAFIGCSDDDDAIVSQAIAQGYLIGAVEAEFGSNTDFYIDIFPLQNNDFYFDSIKFEDSLADYDQLDDYWDVYGDNNYQWASLYSGDNDYMYSAGDTANIYFYRNGTETMLSLKLLDYDVEPNVILPIHNDTVSLGTNINLIWNSVDGADWYGIYIDYYRDSAGTNNHKYQIFANSDTTYTIPDFESIYDGYYNIYIIAVCGPGIGDMPNLNSSGVIGEFHSYSSSVWTRHYVGTGDPTPVSDQLEDPIHERVDIQEAILNKFRGRELRKPTNED